MQTRRALSKGGGDAQPKKNSPVPNRPWGGKKKAPIPVDIDAYSDDEVEEYHFGPMDYYGHDDLEIDSGFNDDDDDDDDDDAKSVITVSSEISASDDVSTMKDRPWKNFPREARLQWEIMYCHVTTRPLGGSWDTTEDFQREKDIEMLEYMKDFPLEDWVIPAAEAARAFNGVRERTHRRLQGYLIYGQQQFPGHLTGPHIQHQALNIPSQRIPQQMQPGGPLTHVPGGHYQVPNHIHHQQVPYHMSPPQYPPPGMVPYQQFQPGPVNYGPPHPTMGYPVGVPQHIPYGMVQLAYPGGPMVHYGAPPPKSRKAPAKKETPIELTPPPPPPTPPYARRPKPSDGRKPASKAGRKPTRRQAEADEFPWTRDLNFPEEKAKITWDESIYDLETMREMEATRARNAIIINEIDSKLSDQQRIARAAKKRRDEGQPTSEADATGGKKERTRRSGQPQGHRGDPYHSGAFSFAYEDGPKIAKELGYKTPDEVIAAGIAGKVSHDDLFRVKICWNPGKKGMTENLEQVKFSARDTVLTRLQLEKTPILNRSAVHCVLDFCPNLLWRGMLLRITSEGGFGNKDVRDRFCHNGCYCDKATITKRISAALGQKQTQPKSKGYGPGEFEWYEQNVMEFCNYIDYFGLRNGHRNMLKIQLAGEKKRQNMLELERASKAGSNATKTSKAGEAASGDESSGPAGKRRKIGTSAAESAKDDSSDDGDGDNEDVDEDDDGEDGEDGHESDASHDSNVVSVQDSDILDAMDED